MDQSDLFTGGHLFHLENPLGPIVNLLGFLIYLPGKICNSNRMNSSAIREIIARAALF